MQEDPNTRLAAATQNLVDRLAQSTLKPLRKRCFECAAKCCDQPGTLETFQNCVQSCDAPAQNSENLLNHELAQFQERLQRCVMSCQDKAKEKLPFDPSQQTPALIEGLNKEVATCANICVDQAIGSLKTLESRYTSAVKNMKM